MSAAAHRSTQSSRSFTRQPLHKPSAMTNDCTRFRPPAAPVRESVSASIVVPSLGLKRPSNEDLPNQPYTFSNPPRETHRQSVQNMRQLRHTHLRHRVSSAPDENSSQASARSMIKQHKPSSANEASTPRAYDEPVIPPLPLPRSVRRDEQQKTSLNALLKEQERSKVPKAVQNRRIILLFRRVPPSTSPTASPRQGHHATPGKADIIAEDAPPCVQKPLVNSPYPVNQQTDSYSNDPFYGFDQAEIADSKQIAAILANMQSLDDWIPNGANDGTSPAHQHKAFDPTKYEYVAKNSLDTATFKLSPRTLKPAEELAARSRFSQNYRYEMLSSANAQVPPLMASIVAENSNAATLGTASEKTYTLRLNSTATMRKQGARREFADIPSTMDGEEVQLCFDEILKCFYDPKTGAYYELSSHR